ncbi:MAG: BglII/BstYI family type II restriction endonuclease [Polaromonas sp.]
MIITRCSTLQAIFHDLGKGSSYGASATRFDKLFPSIIGGGAGGCPVFVFGISPNLYVDDTASSPFFALPILSNDDENALSEEDF